MSYEEKVRVSLESLRFCQDLYSSVHTNGFFAPLQAAIPAEVRMISGCMDSQTSADVSNVSSFKLPDPAGRAGGALTSALLNVCYADNKAPDDDLTYKEVLMKIRSILSSKNFSQIPQLSSSRPMSVSFKLS